MTIFSFNAGFAFLANKKAASTSIHHLLYRKADVIFYRPREGKHLPYKNAQRIARKMSRTPFEDLFVFGVAREPVSWIESWFRFRQRAGIKDPNHPSAKFAIPPECSFEEFANELTVENPRGFAAIGTQVQHFKDLESKVAVDYVVRMDHLQADCADLARLPALEALSRVGETVVNKSAAEAPDSKLPDDIITRLRDAYAEDFELWDRVNAGEYRTIPDELQSFKFRNKLERDRVVEDLLSRAQIAFAAKEYADAARCMALVGDEERSHHALQPIIRGLRLAGHLVDVEKVTA